MYVKKFRKKCDVRGCKNVSDVFIISRRSETGNSVAICKECLQDAIRSIDGYVEEIKKPKPKTSLVPHPERIVKEEVAISSVADDTPNPTEVIDDVTEDNLIDSVTEDTVTDDFFGAVKEEPTAKPNVPTKPKTTAKKPNKASKKKK